MSNNDDKNKNKNSNSNPNDDMVKNSEKKFPRSKKNYDCVGPCYYPKTEVIHPVTMQVALTDKDKPFCPVNATVIDPKTNQVNTILVDECSIPTMSKDYSGKELELNLLTPNLGFNNMQFLKICYGISSITDAIEFINRYSYSPLNTRIRIINSALDAYDINRELPTKELATFFVEIAKKKWVNVIYQKIKKFIIVQNDKVTLVSISPTNNEISRVNNIDEKNDDNRSDNSSDNKSDNRSDDKYYVIKINFIIDKFLSADKLAIFLYKYFKLNLDTKNHIDNIKYELIKYIEKKINTSI